MKNKEILQIQIENYEYELDKESKGNCPDVNYVVYCRNRIKELRNKLK